MISPRFFVFDNLKLEYNNFSKKRKLWSQLTTLCMSKGTVEISRTDNIAETTEIFGYPTDNRLFEMFNLIEISQNFVNGIKALSIYHTWVLKKLLNYSTQNSLKMRLKLLFF